MKLLFIAFVINYCAYCERFEEQALPGIIASQDYQVVVYNDSSSQFVHGNINNIEQYKSFVKGYPTFMLVDNGQIMKTWNGFEEYNFWINYNNE